MLESSQNTFGYATGIRERATLFQATAAESITGDGLELLTETIQPNDSAGHLIFEIVTTLGNEPENVIDTIGVFQFGKRISPNSLQ